MKRIIIGEVHQIIELFSASQEQKDYILVREQKTNKPIGVIIDGSDSGPAKGWLMKVLDKSKPDQQIGMLSSYITDHPEYSFYTLWEKP